uniref:Uncharacterized protein n=1 Tax=Brassica oleracea TaxID=3712 RepID=A0A3P6EEE5_BRAOL|nr:unnamed protein product [Brassica oleracea]
MSRLLVFEKGITITRSRDGVGLSCLVTVIVSSSSSLLSTINPILVTR